MISKSLITVRYAETDRMGIVHHSNYPVWFEVGRTDFTKLLGLTYSAMEEMGVLLPLLELQSRYLSAAHYEDELTVETRLSELSRVKMAFSYRVIRNADGKLLATGRTLHAITDENLKPFNIAKKYPALYETLCAGVTKEP